METESIGEIPEGNGWLDLNAAVSEILIEAQNGGDPNDLYLRLTLLLERAGQTTFFGKEVMMKLYHTFEIRKREIGLFMSKPKKKPKS